jgi:hypothetical protein
MVKLFNCILLIFLLISCDNKQDKIQKEYLKGDPIIVKKSVGIVPGYCIYHYEGWSRREYFEDKCDKYSVGDKIVKD